MHTIRVCLGGSCRRNFSEESLKRAEKVLQIKAGESTPNGEFHLETCGCLSNCDFGPNVLFMNTHVSASSGECISPLSAIMQTGTVEHHMRPDRLEAKINSLRESIFPSAPSRAL